MVRGLLQRDRRDKEDVGCAELVQGAQLQILRDGAWGAAMPVCKMGVANDATGDG